MLTLLGRLCVVARSSRAIMSKQPVSTSSYAMVKAIEELEKNPYFDKYAAKIAKYQKEKPDVFLTKFAKSKEIKESQPGGHGFTKVAEKAKDAAPKSAYSFAAQKNLESIMKMDLLKDKTNEEVTYIWTEHFRRKDAVCGVIPADTYDRLHETAMKYSCFVLPLPRDKGYEFILVQFLGHEAHFTPLINYQAYKENAPECLTMVHYPDLKEERGIVFMQGEFNKDVLNAFEAQFLVNQLQLYYAGNDPARVALLEKFHCSPDKFKHVELVEQLEKLDLSALSNSNRKEDQ